MGWESHGGLTMCREGEELRCWIPACRCCPCSQGDPAGHSINQFKSHARLAQSVERETLTSTRSQGCGFDPRIGLFL
ncbi:Uncharacterized protein HZ326_11713 [Fusarium oxysporum f. sp. albedinis]|nr:Uncharacterized protein HZ326_11713 [Fusarium oxysporum f. sp. albedinis]